MKGIQSGDQSTRRSGAQTFVTGEVRRCVCDVERSFSRSNYVCIKEIHAYTVTYNIRKIQSGWLREREERSAFLNKDRKSISPK